MESAFIWFTVIFAFLAAEAVLIAAWKSFVIVRSEDKAIRLKHTKVMWYQLLKCAIILGFFLYGVVILLRDNA